MRQRLNRMAAGPLVVLSLAAATLTFGGPAAAGPSSLDRSAAARTDATPLSPKAPPAPRTVPVTAIGAGDEMVAGRGDGDGWHLYAAAASGGWAWRPLATLLPHGGDGSGQRWIGRQCMTGDGRHVVAVVAPWDANNTPAGLERGGLAYAVDAHTGSVRQLVGGVSLHYFTPSCGTGSTVALTRFVGQDEQTSQLVSVDAATAVVRATRTVSGQVTGAAPAPDGGFFAARGADVVHIPVSGREAIRARTAGTPFDLVANAGGGADFLVGTGHHSATVWQLNAATSARQVGSGSFNDLALFNGRSGHTVAAGVTRVQATAGIHALPATAATPSIEAVSLNGEAFSPAPDASPGGRDDTATHGSASAGALPQTPLLLRLTNGGKASTKSWTPDVAAPASTAFPRILRDDGTLTPMVGSSAAGGGTRAPSPKKTSTTAAATPPYTSKCAVARNDVNLQVMQPNPAMVDWAANMAGRSLLAGSHARPAGFDNLGLPGYSPSTDFPLPALLGPGGKTVPREVLDAIFAQESNFKQASWHSIQGLIGNPLVADYYAAGGGYQVGVVTDATGAVNPDCGYGLGQVTTGMRTGDPLGYDLQRKVAVDYTENAAASAQILGDKWNELINAGITPNDSNSDYLENWYLALWDYNSGLHPSTSSPWGLGWLNNPANPAYPYNRHPFLHQDLTPLAWKVTYDDASHPADWPYQEKIFGWMEVPIIDSLSGLYSYAGTLETTAGEFNVQQPDAFELARPGRMDFCDPTKNQCNPAVCDKVGYPTTCDPNATQGTGPCTRSDSECWWHYPANWCNPITNVCHSGTWTVDASAAEPSPTGATNWYPPICNIDTSAAGVPPGSTVVDTQPSGLNLEGCNPATANWHNAGSFAFTYGDPDNPNAQATDMDLHQLGAGLSGHMWFTHTNEPLDSNGLPYWGLTGTWTPNLPTVGNFTIKVFAPATGATATQASYSIDPGYGTPTIVTINQNAYTNAWVTLGTFWLGEHAHVSLTNLGTTSSGDLAFTGMAFVPAANPAPYAILGDSYSSGEGTNNYDADTNTSANSCHRSPDAFGRVYATGSSTFASGDVEHLACSGATTDNILTTAKNNEPPQITELMPSAQLVTVTIGANDINFAGVLTRCVTPLVTCEDYYTQNDANNVDTAIENLRAKLTATYTAIKTKAPHATVVAVTYANIFNPGSEGKSGKTCLSIGAIGRSDVEWLIRETFHLDDVIESAARDAGVQFLDERYAFAGHELCTGSPWVNSLLSPPITDISKAFHPNSAGYAQIAADLKSSPVAPATAPTNAVRAAAVTANPSAATWGGWRNATMAARLPSTTRALQLFRILTVASSSNTSYSDTYFGDWSTAPPSARGCNRRTYVLTRDADPGTLTFAPGSTCTIANGTWQSPYNAPGGTLATITGNPMATGSPGSPVDIDHIVSKKDAWVSGADQWIGTAQNPNLDRNDFANDSDGLELLTVSARANNQKGDLTPDQWLPDNADAPGNPAFTCDFLKIYVAVKWQYRLTITLGEWNTINARMTTAACGV